MDFRIYVYKINKGITRLIVKKIFGVILLAALAVFFLLTKPYCTELLKIEPLFLKEFVLFDFKIQDNLIYSSVWIGVAALWLINWLSCFRTVRKIKSNIKQGSVNRTSSTKGLGFSNLLDLICIGWIVPIVNRKKIIIEVYNFGIDDWLDYNGY